VSSTVNPGRSVLIHTDVPLAEVAVQGKNFNWNRPNCGCGQEKVWGHGFISRFIEGFPDRIWLKRYRCPRCKSIFTLLPAGVGRRFRTIISDIWVAIETRLVHFFWPNRLPRQRGGHWLRGFLAICQMDFPEEDRLTVLDRLRGNGTYFI
jgi:hypothetical protein